ncbi:MAG: NAD(P)/FAD-dependent oxidoreductase [Verrucomicrobiota bacterium]
MSRIVIVGGGAAGFFAALACAEASARSKTAPEIVILERGARFLDKVRISGGGRCNVTHACYEARDLAAHYPRGERALIGAFKRFQPSDTVDWFAARGVALKTEADGRMFPVTDSSETIIDCFLREARAAGIKMWLGCGADKIAVRPEGAGFDLTLSNGETLGCDRLLVACGGCRPKESGELLAALGHTLEPPVPSLFTFHIDAPWLRQLAGVSVEEVEASVAGTKLRQRGPFLATHWGASGPVILRLSAWGARVLHGMDYRFVLQINWLPGQTQDAIIAELQSRRDFQAAASIVKFPIRPIPARLWEQLLLAAQIEPGLRWGSLPRPALHRLAQQLVRTELQVTRKSTNKAEFVTCGGVRLSEVDFKTMESRIRPGLYFAGEVLDIDGITGGFNFQAAWTTAWIAGNAMAAEA